MLNGIDVSYAQGQIDWPSVPSSDISFAYAKATEGQSLVDEQFARNWGALAGSQIRRGAYHFLRFTIDPVVQAEHFLDIARPQEGDLVPMVDVEVSDGVDVGACVTRLSQFITRVEKSIGRMMLIYTSYGFWNGSMAGSDAFSGHPLWIAEYNSDALPSLPQGWTSWIIWQHASNGSVNGISNDVDLNRFNGDRTALDKLRLGPLPKSNG